MAEAPPSLHRAVASTVSSANAERASSGPLAKFPPEVHFAHERFLETGDMDALNTVVVAVFHAYQPTRMRALPGTTPPDSARLIEDLGFDSLGLAEIVFFIEDLYKISITNDEIKALSTFGQIKAFVSVKVRTIVPVK